ncbi:MAG: restriction endonuclease subunit S [Gemmataceae bacterium]|nr:restriction endonuclease subunit S [Gemmataceae bacterium]
MSKGWPMVALGEVASPIARPECPVPGKTYRQIGVRLWGEGAYEREPLDGGATKYSVLWRVEAGDIVVNKIWARNGSVAVVSKDLAGCFGSNEFPTFASDRKRLDPRWFHWLTKTAGFWQQCDEKSQGTSGKNRIRPERFLEIVLPLPPLDEQRRIVAKIETLAGKIDEATRLRLLAAEETDALMNAVAAKMIADARDGEDFRIEEIAEVRGGIQKSPLRAPGNNPVRYLTVAHVHRNRIDLDNPRYFEVRPEEQDRWCLKAGDVLIIEGNGSAEQIGRTALFKGEINPCVHQNHVIRIRPDRQRIESEFLKAWVGSRESM